MTVAQELISVFDGSPARSARQPWRYRVGRREPHRQRTVDPVAINCFKAGRLRGGDVDDEDKRCRQRSTQREEAEPDNRIGHSEENHRQRRRARPSDATVPSAPTHQIPAATAATCPSNVCRRVRSRGEAPSTRPGRSKSQVPPRRNATTALPAAVAAESRSARRRIGDSIAVHGIARPTDPTGGRLGATRARSAVCHSS